jgi:uncharacterized protein (TIGR02145 family)
LDLNIKIMKQKNTYFKFANIILGLVLYLASSCKKDDINPAPTVNVPVLTTSSVSKITQVSATSGGNIISDGGSSIIVNGVCWSEDTLPTVSDNTTSDGAGIGIYVSMLTGLRPNTTYYLKAYAVNSDGTGYGETKTFTTLQETEAVIDFDGNIYHTVLIGTQIWMAENLKVMHYRNGDTISNVTEDNKWVELKTGAYCDYNNKTGNGTTYGKLYNWYAVNDSRKIAPAGWHVPTDVEWTALITFLGGENIAGSQMKESGGSHWKNDNIEATNESGFTALPGGKRDWIFGTFSNLEKNGLWWSSTEDIVTSTAWYRELYSEIGNVDRNSEWQKSGLSVRCIKD